MPPIDVGSLAPEFSLPDQHGEVQALKHYRGRLVVLYFYPEDDTPLCTTQACQFRDAHSDFAHIKAAVLGISPEGVESHRKFAAKHDLNFTLLADPPVNGVPEVCKLYGAWATKNMYGREVVGILRTTYLVGPDGHVLKRWDRVKTPGHGAAVLAAAKAAHSGELVDSKPKPAAAHERAVKADKTKPTTTKRSRTHDSDPKFTMGHSRQSSKPVNGRSSNVRGRR